MKHKDANICRFQNALSIFFFFCFTSAEYLNKKLFANIFLATTLSSNNILVSVYIFCCASAGGGAIMQQNTARQLKWSVRSIFTCTCTRIQSCSIKVVYDFALLCFAFYSFAVTIDLSRHASSIVSMISCVKGKITLGRCHGFWTQGFFQASIHWEFHHHRIDLKIKTSERST